MQQGRALGEAERARANLKISLKLLWRAKRERERRVDRERQGKLGEGTISRIAFFNPNPNPT